MLKISKSISLVGMPGAGKTCIGREIAKLTGLPFIDSDLEIKKSAGRDIIDIFEDFGEEHFREGEAKVIKRILNGKKCVLATGGGSFINNNTNKIIKQKSISVFINVKLDTLWQRIQGKKHRPLLKGEGAKKELEIIFKKRYDIYNKADLNIYYNDTNSPIAMAKLIIRKLRKYE